MEVLFDVICFVFAAGAFIYGATKLFRKGEPMYFQILICAVGCYALQEVSSVTTYLCGGFEEDVAISILGILGCVMFILAANRGTLDALVDEHGESGKRARRLAVIAPFLTFVGMLFVIFAWSGVTRPFVVVVVAIVIAAEIPASYYTLKHLLLPKDSLGILECTKWCNIFSFLYLIFAILYCLSFTFGTILSGVVGVLCSLCIVGVSVSAVKGAEKWII
ncbi:MAG: hypothetical protein Q4F70_02545 [Clostridia bacterium]|nr:hypothetical protein [Clostridia bacterium]